MDSNGALRPLDESLLRELPQLSLRIAPLREPVSSRTLSVPPPLEPNASGTRESNAVAKPTSTGGNAPTNTKAGLPTVTEFLNAARKEKAESASDPQSNVEPPPKPILPAFVNLRALERFPFSSSFDDDALYGTRKRRRLDLSESFSEHLQLPIPQAQKEQRPPPFGPFAILNGLNEPPPNAALLPPIEAGSIPQLLTKPSREDAAVDPAIASANGSLPEGQPIERREARIEELLSATLDDHNDDVHDPEDERILPSENPILKSVIPDARENTPNDIHSTTTTGGRLSPKSRGRSRKNLRKWSEEETTDLLRGVVKCGIGNWTAILAQPELKFNKRTASNLKDRFRVCCPWAYRASDPNEATKQLRDNLANSLLKSQAEASNETPGKIRLPISAPTNVGSEPSSGSGSPVMGMLPTPNSVLSIKPETGLGSGSSTPQQSPPPKGTEASSKSQANLASLGIPEPFVSMKAKRRSRRPFTTAEDEALLKGYAVHGFQWTLIQQDKRLNLGHRRATDLRDRFRTKFPHVYRDGGSVNGNAMNPPKLETANSDPGPITRARPASTESTPTKGPPPIVHRRSDSHIHSRQASSASHANAVAGPFDPSFLPPPQGFLEPSANALSFPLEESSAGPSSPWEDNTLAPMIWDDLG
ncbi:hypothetical protein N7466_005945 [Penicillium verhagenii]|uniref:uncharacterized protein n=1 Tax=Penicillium verhagenii TaxID=1562060 RepID=UPI00254554E4|nr:uncharacterized protein N7466_005945 [Penicillium verhagenii]KAJ5930452.1 hypothetical protein N7466_005945 [Penicillium verhagenii]